MRAPRGIDLFYVALPICALVAILGITSPEALEAWAHALTEVVFRGLDWFFLATVTGFLLLSLWLGFGPYGAIKLGRPDEEPEFSTASWLSLLFAAGMGAGLLFWGVAEPVSHFASPPVGEAGSTDAARQATVRTLFHWGLHAWGIYCFSGLVIAYFGFRYDQPHLAGTSVRWAFTGRWVAPVAGAADVIAVLAVAFGVAGSLGTGVMQVHTGMHVAAGWSLESLMLAMGILGALVLVYMASVVSGLSQGIKWLSNLNMLMAVALVVFVVVAGPTAFLLRSAVTATGDYLSALVGLSFQLFPFEGSGQWLETWTLTNFVWWIAWAPFVGVFIARVSRGRTIRSFVMGVLMVPTAFSLVWFVAFGGTALHEELFGAGGMARLVREDVTAALFSLLDRLPFSQGLAVFVIALVFIFLVTSLASATFVLGMLTSRGAADPPMGRQFAWGVAVALLGAALLLSGNVHAVRAVSITGAMPFILVLLLQAVALVRALAGDRPGGAVGPGEARGTEAGRAVDPTRRGAS